MRLGTTARIYGALALAAFLLFLLGCATDSEAPPETPSSLGARGGADTDIELTPRMMENGAVRIERSQQMELVTTLETTGVVSANEARVSHIRPFSRGVIERVTVLRGDHVSAGQKLVLYDNVELGEMVGEYLSLQAQLGKDLAQLEVSRKFQERGEQLLDAEAIARKEVELREAEVKDAQAMVESRRANLSRIEEKLHRFGLSDDDIAQLGSDLDGHGVFHRTKSHTTLRSPFSGVIIGYDVAEGELVEPDRELLTVADLGVVWVLADVYEKDLGRIGEGARVTVRTDAYPDREFAGRLTYISDMLDPATRTAKVRCVVPNPDGALKLEMFASIVIPSKETLVSVAVPEAALQRVDGRDVVFVSLESNRFRIQPVEGGLRSRGWIAVKGLAAGTPVATVGSFYLKSILKREAIGEEH